MTKRLVRQAATIQTAFIAAALPHARPAQVDTGYQVESVWLCARSATASFAAPQVPVKLAMVASCFLRTVKAASSIARSLTVSAVPVAPLALLVIPAICSTMQQLLAWCSVPAASIA